MSCMLLALTSEIAGWIESGLLQIGVLHIATFSKSSPIRRRAFKLPRLGRPFDRPRGLVRANLVWLFLARPNLAFVLAEPNFRATSSSTKSQLMLFFFRRPFPGKIGLIRLAYDLIDSGPFSFPTLLPDEIGLILLAWDPLQWDGQIGEAAQAEERVNPITVADKSHYKILNWRVIE